MGTAAENATKEYQASSYVEGLLIERRGYEQRVEIAADDGDDIRVRKFEKRIAQVDAEIDRVTATAVVTPEVDDVKSTRPAKKAAAKADPAA